MKQIITLCFSLISIIAFSQNGGITVSESTSTDDGTIRYQGGDFEGLKAGTWTSLTGGGGSSLWTSGVGNDIYYNGTGQVGIGLTNPTVPLHISGTDPNIRLEGAAGNTNITLDMWRSGTRHGLLWLDNENDINLRSENADLHLQTGGNIDRLTVSNGGDVGIGTNTPDSHLHIYDGVGDNTGSPNAFVKMHIEDDNQAFAEINAKNWAGYTFANSTQSLRAGMFYNYSGDDLRFQAGGTITRMTIDPNGFVGIGTEAPAKNLDLAASGADIRFSNSNFSAIQWYEGASEVAFLTHNGNDVILQNSDTGILEIEAANGSIDLKTTTQINIGEDAADPVVEILDVSTGASNSGQININNYEFTSADKRAIILGADGSNNEPFIQLKRNDGTIGINIDVDASGDSRITTDELLITGGSDFAENFDIVESNNNKAKPGMIVSIDPNSAGKLTLSTSSYDKRVAGIISGANGVETGVMMGQTGSIADGDIPVALSGRVYVYANDEGGRIQPGDLLTTSSTLGQAMKVRDYKKAQGSVIGKAMTTIDENGFVLVLVNLQ